MISYYYSTFPVSVSNFIWHQIYSLKSGMHMIKRKAVMRKQEMKVTHCLLSALCCCLKKETPNEFNIERNMYGIILNLNSSSAVSYGMFIIRQSCEVSCAVLIRYSCKHYE